MTATEVARNLSAVLDEVEHGETITPHSKASATISKPPADPWSTE
ncbi:hypothetical protein ACFVMC_19205 [Nocardia sp. NPDC127579]